jgi:hypothetical protein
MILETIVTRQAPGGACHIAPVGVHVVDAGYLIMPFRPSTTLENVLASGCAVINMTDDVRIFAGCLTGRRDWPLAPADRIAGSRLRDTLAHVEVEVIEIFDDDTRPQLLCRAVHEAQHQAFRGFNRAQFAVLEAAILVSRLGMLPAEKIEREMAYLQIGMDKTASPREREAWGWLTERIAEHRRQTEARAVPA